jgi:putative aminopeptidase FrvX
MENSVVKFAERLMRHPAAPYHEQAVRAEAEQICAENGLFNERDRFGNLWVRLQTAPERRPLCMVAHLDHPGFQIVKKLGPSSFAAEFRGGVPTSYFLPGTRVVLMPQRVRAEIRKSDRKSAVVELKLHSRSHASVGPEFGVWDLPDFVLRKSRITGRACDDLVGVAAILSTLAALNRKRARVNVTGLLTRAEEVGFHGALAAAESKMIERNALVISLETSRQLPGVKMGKGVIIRTGDRSSIFNSDATRFLTETASQLQKVNQKFLFQRALMSGGTCEGTAFQEYDYQTAAVCVALGNYHNCARNNRIAAEYVSVVDAVSMVHLLTFAAKNMANYTHLVAKLPKRLRGYAKIARRALVRK